MQGWSFRLWSCFLLSSIKGAYEVFASWFGDINIDKQHQPLAFLTEPSGIVVLQNVVPVISESRKSAPVRSESLRRLYTSRLYAGQHKTGWLLAGRFLAGRTFRMRSLLSIYPNFLA